MCGGGGVRGVRLGDVAHPTSDVRRGSGPWRPLVAVAHPTPGRGRGVGSVASARGPPRSSNSPTTELETRRPPEPELAPQLHLDRPLHAGHRRAADPYVALVLLDEHPAR